MRDVSGCLFLKKIVVTLTGIGLALTGSTGLAVQLNPDGLGQALIYPYYNAQLDDDGNVFNTLLSVVNHTGDAKAVRVNIREGRGGYIVLYFNVFLAPNDTWTAAIVPDNLDGKNAKILTQDRSCTMGDIWGLSNSTEGGKSFFSFYSSDPDIDSSKMDRREGYIEMIEMATIPSLTSTYQRVVAGRDRTPSCPDSDREVKPDAVGPNTGGLSGNLTLIDVQSGIGFNVRATALDHFAKPGTALGYAFFGGQAGETYMPDLTSAEPVSVVPGLGDEARLISRWETGTADAVSAVLMHSELFNEYVTESATISQTEWVVTFPTKPYYYEKAWTGSGSMGRRMPIKLFQRDMANNLEACDDYSRTIYGREEEMVDNGCGFLCPPGFSRGFCWTSQVMVFNGPSSGYGDSSVFHSSVRNVLYSKYDSGHGRMELPPVNSLSTSGEKWTSHQLTSDKTTVVRADGAVLKDQTRSYIGLPMVGFAAQTYTNAAISLPEGKVGRSIYGVTVPHSYRNLTE